MIDPAELAICRKRGHEGGVTLFGNLWQRRWLWPVRWAPPLAE
jgi:hypothetical protein